MTNVPDIVWVSVAASIGNSDHSSLSSVISMAQAVTNFYVSRKVLLKQCVNWDGDCGPIQDLPWRNIWSADKYFGVIKELLSLLVGHYLITMQRHRCAQQG